jgi:enoyl-CoA hydratase/carnithine racemase
LFGAAVAKRMILAGELFPAAEALRFGIVDNVSPDAEFQARVEGRVKLLLSRGPQALRLTKRLIDEFSAERLAERFEAEVEAFGRCFASGEGAEGSRAFLEKRAPDWG